MSLYTEILKLDGYFNSIRLHEGLLIVDLKIPIKWEIKKVLNQRGNKIQIQVGANNEKFRIVSFFGPFDEENALIIQEEITAVIKWNKDMEEKDFLLNTKMIELQKMFNENNIDSLRHIDINFNTNLSLDGKTESSQLVPKGNFEGPKGNINT